MQKAVLYMVMELKYGNAPFEVNINFEVKRQCSR
jgi:hypothetical protein